MPVDLADTRSLISVLLVFARVATVCALLPVPGLRQAGPVGLVVLSLAGTFAMSGVWTRISVSQSPAAWEVIGGILSEASLGLMIGLCVNLCVEVVVMAAQFVGMQAGFTYASTVNPTADADANVIQIVLQLYAMLLFVSLGMDRLTMKALALSIEHLPPGSWFLERGHMFGVVQLISSVWVTATRLALPVIGLLLMLDLTLALFGRVCTQLQLLTVAFPVKTLLAIGALALLIPTYVTVFEEHALRLMSYCASVLNGGRQ